MGFKFDCNSFSQKCLPSGFWFCGVGEVSRDVGPALSSPIGIGLYTLPPWSAGFPASAARVLVGDCRGFSRRAWEPPQQRGLKSPTLRVRP